MQYYIETIEQTKIDGVLNEYGKTEKVGDLNSALVKYYNKLAEVQNDIGKSHTYMLIKVIDSQGYEIKKEYVGEYVEEVTE